MRRILAWTTLLLVLGAAGVSAQQVTSVPNSETIEVAGVGKVRLAGIKRGDRQVSVGPAGARPPQTPSNPAMPPPLISGGVNMSPDRSGQTALRELLLGKDVRIEFDELSKERKDRRAYVYLEDGTLVNAQMLRQGHARVDTSAPFTREAEFKDIEAEARDSGRGIWADVRR